MKRTWIYATVLLLLASASVASASFAGPKAQTTDIAAEAYVYGYPLVLMEFTRQQGFALGYPLNGFHHDRQLKGPEDKDVVRQNTDNLYSSAFVDLTAEPLVLHVPDTTGRYYLLQIMDGWTNTFASPGSRTTGSAAQDFILAGPDWRGSLRGDTPVLRAPTNLVWIIGRTEVRHFENPAEQDAELATVHAIQDQYTLTPLGEWLHGGASPRGALSVVAGGYLTPIQRLMNLTVVEFLQMLSDLMAKTPADGWDRPALRKFEEIGLYPGRPFNPPAALQDEINAARPIADARLATEWRSLGVMINGWGVVLTELGTFGTDYLKRAAVAQHGLGANLLKDAIYHTAYQDVNDKPLDASTADYRIHFPAGQTPPALGFWSITLYEGDYFFANPENRYAIHNTDLLLYNTDGSLDLYIQTGPPDDPALRANWLPAPNGPFNLTIRIYWPDKSALKEKWLPAPIEPLSANP